MKHRKKRKTRKCKLKLGKTLAEIAENAERFGQAKAWFYLLAENAENAERFDKLKLGFIFSQKTRKTQKGLGKLKLGFIFSQKTQILLSTFNNQ